VEPVTSQRRFVYVWERLGWSFALKGMGMAMLRAGREECLQSISLKALRTSALGDRVFVWSRLRCQHRTDCGVSRCVLCCNMCARVDIRRFEFSRYQVPLVYDVVMGCGLCGLLRLTKSSALVYCRLKGGFCVCAPAEVYSCLRTGFVPFGVGCGWCR